MGLKVIKNVHTRLQFLPFTVIAMSSMLPLCDLTFDAWCRNITSCSKLKLLAGGLGVDSPAENLVPASTNKKEIFTELHENTCTCTDYKICIGITIHHCVLGKSLFVWTVKFDLIHVNFELQCINLQYRLILDFLGLLALGINLRLKSFNTFHFHSWTKFIQNACTCTFLHFLFFIILAGAVF